MRRKRQLAVKLKLSLAHDAHQALTKLAPDRKRSALVSALILAAHRSPTLDTACPIAAPSALPPSPTQPPTQPAHAPDPPFNQNHYTHLADTIAAALREIADIEHDFSALASRLRQTAALLNRTAPED
jgi:hypothetical protein